MDALFHQAYQNPSKIAIVDHTGSYSYQQLIEKTRSLASFLLQDKEDLKEARVAYMVSPGLDYVAVQWGIWMAGGIAVPLCITYPFPSLQYVIEDTEAELILVGPEYEQLLQTYAEDQSKQFIRLADGIPNQTSINLPSIASHRGAMILYTSGTTSLPKGVLTTHAAIEAQVITLIEAWKWTSQDYTLCLLPLHHVHGIINVVSCSLWAGATVQFVYPFDAKQVFEIFLEGKVTVFMAVPTIYFKLITRFESESERRLAEISYCLKKMRLMVSGSAALPVSVMEKWQQLSGHYLLERYGMTEIGMAISNPYEGERRAGYIGQALPGVKIRIVDENQKNVPEGEPGEIQVKGPSVFREYWGKEKATRKAFTSDGWFMTGDIATVENGYIRILGRDSVDIIKSGGYKISALEIEEILRKHPEIDDCGVVGLLDEEWGELVAAAIISTEKLDLKELNAWIRERMPAYKTPRKYIFLTELPRNAMGKVVKNDLKILFN
ncbi:malonyl-CoA/methylmalonyl-CoA synthetase [Algoriphagus alkaliphilus]|uniref:Malonyl-CoA/methylmalonyl-CoA synthetase n=1 Tax=Algoriphagus alkaliphilus TaxID=279824 RepID=A0A1G5Z5X1_9BACT|nr:acyl-CoA synthetase [Algoriphagus alkaliphilus]SDA90268.1 malonyl-CoA/methylmalonyl-CoA synthetase [Algoriphagus alkaliphilus]